MAKAPPNTAHEDISDLERDFYAHVHGVLLSDLIKRYVRSHSMIQPFCEDSLEPAGYQMRVGERYFRGTQEVELQDNGTLEIKPSEVVIIETIERLRLPRFLIARWSIKVKLVYNGLLWAGGAQVDPGYYGKLSCPIYNLSTKPVILHKGDKFAMIDFVKTTPYSSSDCKPFRSLPVRDARYIVHSEGGYESTLSKHIEEIEEVKKTADSVRSQSTYFSTLVITLLGVLLAVSVGRDNGLFDSIPEWSAWVRIGAVALSLAISTSALLLVLERAKWGKLIIFPVVLVVMFLLGVVLARWGPLS